MGSESVGAQDDFPVVENRGEGFLQSSQQLDHDITSCPSLLKPPEVNTRWQDMKTRFGFCVRQQLRIHQQYLGQNWLQRFIIADEGGQGHHSPGVAFANLFCERPWCSSFSQRCFCQMPLARILEVTNAGLVEVHVERCLSERYLFVQEVAPSPHGGGLYCSSLGKLGKKWGRFSDPHLIDRTSCGPIFGAIRWPLFFGGLSPTDGGTPFWDRKKKQQDPDGFRRPGD